jgi:hypothetical protein
MELWSPYSTGAFSDKLDASSFLLFIFNPLVREEFSSSLCIRPFVPLALFIRASPVVDPKRSSEMAESGGERRSTGRNGVGRAANTSHLFPPCKPWPPLRKSCSLLFYVYAMVGQLVTMSTLRCVAVPATTL